MTEPLKEYRSIQGDQQAERERKSGHVRMDKEDVQEYTKGASAGTVGCREGGHRFPTIREVGIVFEDEDGVPEGQKFAGCMIRLLRCTGCRLVGRREFWTEVDGDWECVFSKPDYTSFKKRGPNAESYLAPPGLGRMTRKQVRAAEAANLLHGQTLATIRRQIRAAAKAAA